MKQRAKDHWAAVSTVVAVLSLLAVLVFNAIAVRDTSTAQQQARTATELGLMTQLQAELNESVYGRVKYAAQFDELDEGKRRTLTPLAYRALAEEATNMDYLAWLFNSGALTTQGSDELWGPVMICEYQQAIAPSLQQPAQEVPQLVRFIQQRGRRLSRLTDQC